MGRSFGSSTHIDSNYRLKLGCFNLRGFNHNHLFLSSLLPDFDILAVSEHWLHASELSYFSRLGDKICFSVRSQSMQEDPSFCYPGCLCGKGGVAVIWRKWLDSFVDRLPIDSDRIVGIRLLTSHRSICFSLFIYQLDLAVLTTFGTAWISWILCCLFTV